MKLKRFELCTIIIALVLIGFGFGYFIGRGNTPRTISITPLTNTTDILENSSESFPKSEDNADDITELININTADKDTLCKLEGIGEVLAERILEYRNTNGKFSSVEELINVYGIGDKIFDGIKDYITV